MEAHEREEWQQRYRGALQSRLDEPVLASGLVHGSGDELPDQFLLAVTPTRIHAFEAAFGASSVVAGAEVAVWQRLPGGE
jgi:hypothetical protein